VRANPVTFQSTPLREGRPVPDVVGISGETFQSTPLREGRLLRASHIKPWAKCGTDAERLDVYNGLLLAAHLDAAFDAGLISFADDGAILFSPEFTMEDRDTVGIHHHLALRRVGGRHLPNLAWHRTFLLGNKTEYL
jgi:putative restriction endonuclease